MRRGPRRRGAGREWGGARWRGGGWEGASVDPTAVEAGVEKEQVCNVDPTTVGQVPTWTQRRWRHGGDRGRVHG
jgi:hypothetical protein